MREKKQAAVAEATPPTPVPMATCRQCSRKYPLDAGLVEIRIGTMPKPYNPQDTRQITTCPICQAHLEKNGLVFNGQFTADQLDRANEYVEAERQRRLAMTEARMAQGMKPGLDGLRE